VTLTGCSPNRSFALSNICRAATLPAPHVLLAVKRQYSRREQNSQYDKAEIDGEFTISL
jgi:hypothetical protein